MNNQCCRRRRWQSAPFIFGVMAGAMLSACSGVSVTASGTGGMIAQGGAAQVGATATTVPNNGGRPGNSSANPTGGTDSPDNTGTGGQVNSNGARNTGGASTSKDSTGGKATGGSVNSGTGGAKPTGGSGNGGNATGGFNFSFGGVSTGGSVNNGTGGAKPTGGSGNGGNATGGFNFSFGGAGTGGTKPTTGGTSPTGTGGGSTVTDPNAATAISACIDKMPWGQDNIKDRNKLMDVIIKTCVEFAPPAEGWQTYCQMFLVSAIVTESSFNADSVVQDSYGGSADPTVGLTQIRYSSTVKDFARKGNKAALERIGCTLIGTAGANDTGSQHLDLMKDVACNVGLGAWYYFLYATGNGGTQVVYLDQYCAGNGVGATLVTGMLSHQKGPSGAIGAAQNDYTNNIRKYFNSCLTVSGTHPFDMKLQPSISQYCG